MGDGADGIRCPRGNAGELGEALIRSGGDAARRARLGASGRERVRRDYGMESMVSRTESAYLEVIESGKVPV